MDQAVVGDILGQLEGEVDGDILGEIHRKLNIPRQPAWRRQIAPGVGMPGEKLQLLPLTPDLNAGVFDATHTSIRYTAKPQRAFHAERIVAIVRRSGAGEVALLASGIFVGVEPQTLQIAPFDIETFAPNAFGVRLAMNQATPGIEVSIPVATSSVPAGTDFAFLSLVMLGKSIAG